MALVDKEDEGLWIKLQIQQTELDVLLMISNRPHL